MKKKEPAIELPDELAALIDQTAGVQNDVKALTTVARVDPEELRQFLESARMTDDPDARALLEAVENAWRTPAGARRLIVCADHVWASSTPVEFSSNLSKLARSVSVVDANGAVQVVYTASSPSSTYIERMSGAFGAGVAQEITDSYRFLADNYSEGDQIFLFGFSRGGHVVRQVARMIDTCGLVRKEHTHRIAEAYRLTTGAKQSEARASEFRQAYSREVRIQCIGVWEAVESLVLPPWPLSLFFRRTAAFREEPLGRTVANAFQALAIDERRLAFRPTLWVSDNPEQRLEQVWFAGSHSDVGGGYEGSRYADVALLWMIERARECGLAFDESVVAQFAPDPLGKLHDSTEALANRLLLQLGTRKIRGRRGNTHEAVHPSVLQRYEHDPGYRPRNLREVLALPVAEPTMSPRASARGDIEIGAG